MAHSLDAELDATTRFPEWVNNRIHNNDADPIMAALKTLPEDRKANVMRQLEHALHQEDLTMPTEDRLLWIQRAELMIPHDCVEMTIRYNSNSRYHTFRTVEEAAQFLRKSIRAWDGRHKNFRGANFNVKTNDIVILRQLVFEQRELHLASDTYRISVTIKHRYFNLKHNNERVSFSKDETQDA